MGVEARVAGGPLAGSRARRAAARLVRGAAARARAQVGLVRGDGERDDAGSMLAGVAVSSVVGAAPALRRPRDKKPQDGGGDRRGVATTTTAGGTTGGGGVVEKASPTSVTAPTRRPGARQPSDAVVADRALRWPQGRVKSRMPAGATRMWAVARVRPKVAGATRGIRALVACGAGALAAFALVVALACCTVLLTGAGASPEGLTDVAQDLWRQGVARGDEWWRGEPFRAFVGDGSRAWDVSFVCFCLDACGLGAGAPKTSDAEVLIRWWSARPTLADVCGSGDGWPRPGDVWVRRVTGGRTRMGIVVAVAPEGFTTVEGDVAGSAGTTDEDATGVGGHLGRRQYRRAGADDIFVRLRPG